MRISDWSSDVCSSDLPGRSDYAVPLLVEISQPVDEARLRQAFNAVIQRHDVLRASFPLIDEIPVQTVHDDRLIPLRSEEHTSELQSLMRILYAVFCLKKQSTQTMPAITTTYTYKDTSSQC